MELDDTYAAIHYYRGIVLYHLERHKEARKEISKADDMGYDGEREAILW